jgi:phosphoglycolate phosphatase-like HAD superfamily hydrolase
MKPTIVLFDIDGTLISTGGAGRRALVRTFDTLFGKPQACAGFSFAGMTDRAIARGGLSAISVEPTDETIAAVLAQYLVFLNEELVRADRSKYRVHVGMTDAVQASLSESMAVGLGTGNIREGAMAKLKHVALAEFFKFGGFGDDHEHRPTLILRGVERGAAQLGVPREEARVVIIGDTPKDVAAAQAVGALSIGVGTGDYTAQQLREVGATWAFNDFSDPNALEALLRGTK